jgi:hypothetical protein
MTCLEWISNVDLISNSLKKPQSVEKENNIIKDGIIFVENQVLQTICPPFDNVLFSPSDDTSCVDISLAINLFKLLIKGSYSKIQTLYIELKKV